MMIKVVFIQAKRTTYGSVWVKTKIIDRKIITIHGKLLVIHVGMFMFT